MAILSNLYTKSKNYNYTLTLAGIVPVAGFYKTALTGTHFIRGEKIEAVKTKITDTPQQMVITWPKPKNGVTKYQLSLQGVQTVKNIEAHHAPTLKLIDTKTVGVKKAPAVAILAPLTTEQKDESGDSESKEDDEDPEHSAALARLLAQLEHELDLEEELEEEEAEQEESGDWVADGEAFDVTKRPLAVQAFFDGQNAKPVAPTGSNFTDHPCAIATGVSGIYSVKHQSLISFISTIKDNTSIKLNWVRTPYKDLVKQEVAIRQTDTIFKPAGKKDGKNTYDNLGAFSSITEEIGPDWRVARNEEFITLETLHALKNSDNASDVAEYGYQKKRLSGIALGKFNGTILPEKYEPNSSSIIPLDFDKLSPDELVRLKAVLCSIPEIVFCFTSISGVGLKAGLCVGPIINGARYKQCFTYAREWLKSIDSSLILDDSGSDIKRLIFTSSDSKAYFNSDATILVVSEVYVAPSIYNDKPQHLNKSNLNKTSRALMGRFDDSFLCNDFNKDRLRIGIGELYKVNGNTLSEAAWYFEIVCPLKNLVEQGWPEEEAYALYDEVCQQMDGYEVGYNDKRWNEQIPPTDCDPKTYKSILHYETQSKRNSAVNLGGGATNIHSVKSGYISTKNKGYTCAQWMDICNSNLAVVCVNGSMKVVSLGYDTDKKQAKWSFVSFETFRQRYNSDYLWYSISKMLSTGRGNNKVTELVEDEVQVNAGTYWLENESRVGEADLIFDPERPIALTVRGVVNKWTGLNISASSEGGNAMPMINHIKCVLGNNIEEHGSYIINWLAFLLQHPGERHGVALVLRGKKGIGKGTLGNLLVKIFGMHGKSISKPNHLIGQFTGHLKDLCFLLVDEGYLVGNPDAEGILNGIISEPLNMSESKGVDADDVVNHLSLLILTNKEHVITATEDERRYTVLDVPETYLGDKVYWTMITDWEKNPANVSAFVEYLLAVDLTNYSPKNFIETEALKDQRAFSLGVSQQWWGACLRQGYFGSAVVWPEYLSPTLIESSLEAFLKRKRFKPDDCRNVTEKIPRLLNKHKLAPAATQIRVNAGDDLIHSTSGNWGDLMDRKVDTNSKELKRDNRIYLRKMPSLQEARKIFIDQFKLPKDYFEVVEDE